MIQLKFRQFQTDSEDDSAMIQKGIFHEGSVHAKGGGGGGGARGQNLVFLHTLFFN